MANSGNEEQRRKVLFIDDSEDAHVLYRAYVRGSEFEMTSVLDGRTALSMLRSGVQPDVIVVDLLMPAMDGMEVYEAVRRLPEFRDTPIVIASAVAVPALFQLSDVVYLTKPVRPPDLLRVLHRAAAGHPRCLRT